ncbi:MAG: division/cell wall cluster transcriptional repressor MraZ [Anaerococcus vaginalis]|uniref:division/cell wall cluster transcriptional repressor MraZ n=1 Tax=Anaerococcus TaxID=165779 RepID=UPI00242C68F9|nr:MULTISPECIES: division/cell wall cluster transcriptional repressor MraZ [Anaerococcus]MDD7765652.1 division/cell wall cluster transcriptional repressor MraZ [Anaerococcus vaginalis]MDU1763449.1 division/cell wall cluster transcriptional repressor MraZ [Anaerococcus vaginalis]MDY6127817.1 division/cell wall cluster transcriptional repressor MraZ [Anaerococcus sp.]
MFLGEFIHKLDSKNRIMMPSEFRDELGNEFYVTKGPERSLVLYTIEEFEKRAKKYEELSYQNKNNRAIKRLFFSSTIKAYLDKQGRVLLNKQLRDYANLGKEAIIIGNNSNIEIWDLNNWNDYIGDVEVNLSEIMDQ